MEKANYQQFFSKMAQFFNLKNGIYVKEQLSMDTRTKFEVQIMKKTAKFCLFVFQRRPLYGDFDIFPIFKLCPVRAVQRVFWPCLRSFRKTGLMNMLVFH